jgi:hypothetical protein
MRDYYAIQRHVLSKGGVEYTFKNGVTKTIDKSNYTTLTKGEQQAVAKFLAKKNPKPLNTQETKLSKGGQTFNPNKSKILKEKNDQMVMKFIKNFQPVTVGYEEKLHIPKVFAALLSQPHTAFDQVRKYEYENKGKILLIVDEYSAYWSDEHANESMHAALVNFTSKDKNVHHLVVSGEFAKMGSIYQNPKFLDKYDKVLFVSQGCGSSHAIPKNIAKKMTFITIFEKGCNCGCSRISQHERDGCDVRYSIKDWGDLLALK